MPRVNPSNIAVEKYYVSAEIVPYDNSHCPLELCQALPVSPLRKAYLDAQKKQFYGLAGPAGSERKKGLATT